MFTHRHVDEKQRTQTHPNTHTCGSERVEGATISDIHSDKHCFFRSFPWNHHRNGHAPHNRKRWDREEGHRPCSPPPFCICCAQRNSGFHQTTRRVDANLHTANESVSPVCSGTVNEGSGANLVPAAVTSTFPESTAHFPSAIIACPHTAGRKARHRASVFARACTEWHVHTYSHTRISTKTTFPTYSSSSPRCE